jgi:hypothetical protein
MFPLVHTQGRLAIASLVVAASSALAVTNDAFADSIPSSRAQLATATAPRAATSRATSDHLSANRALIATGAPVLSAALDTTAAGADPFTVEPRVPRAAGTPCVVELQRNVQFGRAAETEGFQWDPPTNCPGPWSKAILLVELTGPRPSGEPNANLRLMFYGLDRGGDAGGGMLFMGAPQEHAGLSTWWLERDVTEIASIFTHRQFLYALSEGDNAQSYDPDFSEITASRIRVVLFPATTRTPAPRIADMVVGSTQPDVGYALDLQLPRNIERAYLDVYSQVAEGNARAWYSCVPSADAQRWPSLLNGFAMGGARQLESDPDQGCAAANGSYREVEVTVDGTLAGLAPVFPWLPSNIHNHFRGTVDLPAPTVQALNMLPFRVDLTPFAALLSDGLPHNIGVRQVAGGGYVFAGQLLLYLDHGRTQVTGALTRNTLANQPSIPIVSDGLAQSGDTVAGVIDTRLQRQFVIEGYVDTSHGRITSRVVQTNRFVNTQTLSVTGLATSQIANGTRSATDYVQKVRLSSTVNQTSQRLRGTTLLSDDRLYLTYPLLIDYRYAGDRVRDSLPYTLGRTFAFKVHQARGLRSGHFRRGMTKYDTTLSDVLDASHDWTNPDDGTPPVNSNWLSTRTYLFTDTLGSCYSAGLTTAAGVLQTRTRGSACPNGNGIRWFAHPDGSPDAIGWGAQPQ